MSLAAMRAYCAVVEEGAFARAARRLRVSNATISQRVSALESALDVRLLHRTTRRLSVTPEGQAYYERARALLGDLDALNADTRSRTGAPTGRVRVAAPMTYGLARVAPLLGAFHEAYPGVEVELRLADHNVDLVGEGVDVALRVAHKLPDTSLVATRLAAFERRLVAAPSYLASRGPVVHPSALTEHACVRFLQLSNPDVWVFERAGDEVSVRVSGPLSTNNSLAMVDALVDGVGLALIPEVAVRAPLATGALVSCLPDWQPRARSVFAVYPTRRHLTPRVRAFVDFVASALAAEAEPPGS